MKSEVRRSQAQEKRVAQKTGGTVNPGSGSGWRKPHDVREDDVLWEMKRTDKKVISLKLSDLESVRRQAVLSGRTPIMHLEFGKRRYVILEEGDYLDLVDGGSVGRERGTTG